MGKKINCKHGLDMKQEIQARRLRVKLEEGDIKTLKEYKLLWRKYMSVGANGFEKFLKNEDIVYYSAYVRACQSLDKIQIYNKIISYSIET